MKKVMLFAILLIGITQAQQYPLNNGYYWADSLYQDYTGVTDSTVTERILDLGFNYDWANITLSDTGTTYDDTLYIDKGFKVLVADTNLAGYKPMVSDTLWYAIQFIRDSTWTNATQPFVDDNSIRTFTAFVGDAELLRIRLANVTIVAGRVFKFYAILSRKK
jgi:hypothetical protein